jgi:hypothetical protein
MSISETAERILVEVYTERCQANSILLPVGAMYEDVSKSFRTESITKQKKNNKHSLTSSTKGYGGKTH